MCASLGANLFRFFENYQFSRQTIWSRYVVNLTRNVSLNRSDFILFCPYKTNFPKQKKVVCLPLSLFSIDTAWLLPKIDLEWNGCFKTCVCMCICFGLRSRCWFIGGMSTHLHSGRVGFISGGVVQIERFHHRIDIDIQLKCYGIFFDISIRLQKENSGFKHPFRFYHENSLFICKFSTNENIELVTYYCVAFWSSYFIC